MSDFMLIDENHLKHLDINTFGSDDPRLVTKLEDSDGCYIAFNCPNREIMPYSLIVHCSNENIVIMKEIEGYIYLPQKATIIYGGLVIKGDIISMKKRIIDVIRDLLNMQFEDWDLPGVMINFVSDIEVKEADYYDDDQSSSTSLDQGIVGVDNYFMIPKLDLNSIGVNELLKKDKPAVKDLTRLKFKKDPTSSNQHPKFTVEYKSSQESSKSSQCSSCGSPGLNKFKITTQHFDKIKEILITAENNNEAETGEPGTEPSSNLTPSSSQNQTPKKRLLTTVVEQVPLSPFKVPKLIEKEVDDAINRMDSQSPIPSTSNAHEEFEVSFSQPSENESSAQNKESTSQISDKSNESDIEIVFIGNPTFKQKIVIKQEPEENKAKDDTDIDYDVDTIVGDPSDVANSDSLDNSDAMPTSTEQQSSSGKAFVYSEKAISILEERLDPNNVRLDGDFYILPENQSFYEDGYYYIEGLIPVRHQLWTNVRKSNDLGSNISSIMAKALGPAYGRYKRVSLVGTQRTKSLSSMILQKCNIKIPKDYSQQQVEEMFINTIIDACLRPIENSRLTKEQRKVYRTKLSTSLSSYQLRFCPGKRQNKKKANRD